MSQNIYMWIFLKVTCDEVKIQGGKGSTKCEQQYGKKQKAFGEIAQPWPSAWSGIPDHHEVPHSMQAPPCTA